MSAKSNKTSIHDILFICVLPTIYYYISYEKLNDDMKGKAKKAVRLGNFCVRIRISDMCTASMELHGVVRSVAAYAFTVHRKREATCHLAHQTLSIQPWVTEGPSLNNQKEDLTIIVL
ncbi:hypothetical protein CEXT_788271 [Caerostris extrusa]|uniref:Uncharacterized protein n=1 Tax=Caerostris extrusa TaxID=172846 RepID=A0AAV4YAU2_CAEEX|nr:hypothetical protein CEXT_788271 [Caerostris extrusa]